MVEVRDELFIGGSLRRAHSTERLPVINPATEEHFASIVDANEVDVDRAVRTADDAFRSAQWRAVTPPERAGMLRRLADIIESRAAELGRLVTTQNGMVLANAVFGSGPATAGYYRYFADLADRLEIESERSSLGPRTVVRREPVGVAALVVPWNGPQGAIAWKLGPALAAGCTAVVKPAPETSLDSYILAEAVQQAGIPAGVVNIITGGRGTGEQLVAHPLVRKVGFTGSTVAGRKVAATCAETFKRVTLELGGKSAAILLDDADFDKFAPFVASACSPFSGQICRALTRVLAPRSRYDEAVELVTESFSTIPVGDPLDPRHRSRTGSVGPSARTHRGLHRQRPPGRCEARARRRRPAGFDQGYYVEPTVFRDADNTMRIAREEIFGPVITVLPYDDEEDAVRIANDSDYGLGGAVFTADQEHGMALARRIESGTVGVNHYALPIDAPFGGVKQSGIGRELGPEGLAAYLETKSIYVAAAP